MRKAPYMFALAAISGLGLMAGSSSASSLAIGLASGRATLPALTEGLVQKVRAWSCQEKRRDMTLEQRRFCDGYYDDYEDYGPGYGYASPGYGYGYQGYGLGVPFIGFEFGGGRHPHHHGDKWH